MLLKDRLKGDSAYPKGDKSGKRAEPCRRFNKGKCNFGLACKYDHRCAIKRCGKFGHGAHVCHLRHTESSLSSSPRKDNHADGRRDKQ